MKYPGIWAFRARYRNFLGEDMYEFHNGFHVVVIRVGKFWGKP